MRSSSVRALAHIVAPPHPLPGGLHLAHEPLSAGVARSHVRSVLAAWNDSERVQDALLLTTELVSNAILHGSPDVVLRAELADGERLRVEVFDSSRGMPRVRAAWAGGGRGLTIVEDTADGWGVIPSPDGGKTVWFELLG
jgi:anti-sigma regulatory factor (Ser/Thr protein kinase)